MGEFNEFNEMREQLSSFKKDMDKQDIISGSMIRESVSTQMSSIHRYRNKIIGLEIIAIVINMAYFILMDFSLGLMIYTASLLAFCIFMTLKNHQEIERLDVMDTDLLTMTKTLRSLKHRHSNYYMYSIPVILIYAIWFSYETFFKFDGWFAVVPIMCICIGSIIGAVCGMSLNRKLICMCDNLIAEIEG